MTNEKATRVISKKRWVKIKTLKKKYYDNDFSFSGSLPYFWSSNRDRSRLINYARCNINGSIFWQTKGHCQCILSFWNSSRLIHSTIPNWVLTWWLWFSRNNAYPRSLHVTHISQLGFIPTFSNTCKHFQFGASVTVKGAFIYYAKVFGGLLEPTTSAM